MFYLDDDVSERILILLLEYGADTSMQNNGQQSPLDVAHNLSVRRLLQDPAGSHEVLVA